jgi:hypothetical protein
VHCIRGSADRSESHPTNGTVGSRAASKIR